MFFIASDKPVIKRIEEQGRVSSHKCSCAMRDMSVIGRKPSNWAWCQKQQVLAMCARLKLLSPPDHLMGGAEGAEGGARVKISELQQLQQLLRRENILKSRILHLNESFFLHYKEPASGIYYNFI